MRGLRAIALAFLAMVLAACGSGVKSPDFTPVLESLSIDTPTSLSVAAGRSLTLSSTGQFTNPPGSDTPTFGDSISPAYSVDDPSVARIDGSNLVGLKVGQVVVSATKDGITSDNTVTINVTPAVLESIVVTPATVSVAKGASATLTAMGVYSDSSTPRAILTPINWVANPPANLTVSPDSGPNTTITGLVEGAVTVSASSLNEEGDTITRPSSVTVTAPVLASLLRVTPAGPSVALGLTQEFTAVGLLSDGTETNVPDANIDWSSGNTAVASIVATGVATARAVGSTSITARVKDGVTTTSTDPAARSASTTITVTAPVLQSIVITPADPTIPAGTTVNLRAMGVYSDSAAPRDINAGTTVSWQVISGGAFVSVAPATGALTVATGNAQGSATVQASAVNEASVTIMSTTSVTVTNPNLTALIRVETDVTAPAVPSNSAFVIVGATAAYRAIGSFSDGSTGQVLDSQLDWTPATGSPQATVASVDAAGVATGVQQGTATITATLKAGVSPEITGANRTKSGTLIVTDTVCTAPFREVLGATVTPETTGLCLLCAVNDPGFLIDEVPDNAASVQVPVGLLTATAGLLAEPAPGTTFQSGTPTGFVISRPAGLLLSAEVLSQISVSTTVAGQNLESSLVASDPLRLTLLGTIGGQDLALLSFTPTMDFEGLRLTFGSGVASALTSVNVVSACATVAPPAP